MTRTTTCISIFFPVFFAALAMVIWAAIFELPLLPGMLIGSAIGIGIGAWYYRSAKKAIDHDHSLFRECVSVNTTILSIVLFADLFASMLVWSVKELF